jgi:hypothetical protein
LAQYALQLGEEKVWEGVTPACIQDIVQKKKNYNNNNKMSYKHIKQITSNKKT